MPDLISSAKEVYFKIPKDSEPGGGVNKMVAVRGVYVTGVYKPPLYLDSGVQLIGITSEPAEIHPYTSATGRTYMTDGGNLHITRVAIDLTGVETEDYMTSYAPDQVSENNLHVYDVSINPSFQIEWYLSTVAPDQTSINSLHVYDVIISPTMVVEYWPVINSGNQPEPIIRLTDITSTCTITNYTPN